MVKSHNSGAEAVVDSHSLLPSPHASPHVSRDSTRAREYEDIDVQTTGNATHHVRALHATDYVYIIIHAVSCICHI